MAINQFASFTRGTNTSWQLLLRQSVRLYLALGSPPVDAAELETLLQHTEEELVAYLLQGERPSAEAVAQARHLVDMAQHELLGSTVEVQQMLDEAELSYHQTPLPKAA